MQAPFSQVTLPGRTSAQPARESQGGMVFAALPLKVLEEIDLLKGPAKEVRRVQDHTLGAIYHLIREVNRQVGSFAGELLAEAAKHTPAREGAAAKSHTRQRTATH